MTMVIINFLLIYTNTTSLFDLSMLNQETKALYCTLQNLGKEDHYKKIWVLSHEFCVN